MMETQSQSEGLVADFCEEALDLLQELPQKLTQYACAPEDQDAINFVFRAVHTVKGNAGFFGLPVVKRFAHSLEDALDEIRQGVVEVDDELTRSLVEAIDVLTDMVVEIQNGAADAAELETRGELLERIQAQCEQSRTDSEEARLLAELRALANDIAAARLPQSDEWSARLKALAGAASVTPNAPTEAADSPENEEEISVRDLADAEFSCAGTDVTERVVPLLEVFLKVDAGDWAQEDGCNFLHAAEDFARWAQERGQDDLAAALSAARDDFATVFNSPLEMDAFLLSAVWQELAPALERLRRNSTKDVSARQVEEDADKQSQGQADFPNGTRESPAKKRFLRVREERVDDFLEDVSDLFITCERLKDLQSRMAGQFEAQELVDELRQINATLSGQSTALQRSVVGLRKVPARGLFAKFPRVARSLASKLGKQLDVHVEGEEIEIDKSLVEDLDGPLMHMVRNVCDHAIETPDERQRRGVSPTGNLWLSCSLSKSDVVITVRDDGRGIDPERLRHKAVNKGILGADEAAALSDQEAVELVFHPGFSTAEQVSDVSGRGVGMDVVRTRLRDHNGDVKVTSVLGEGTTFRLEIPIRRAVVVVDGLLVRQGDATFIIPFEHIHEIVRIRPGELSTVQGQWIARVRGEPYAAMSLSELLQTEPPAATDNPQREGVLIKFEERALLLLVETVIGQRKVVISDLSSVLPYCDRISGVAQLGGGSLALVLNAGELVHVAAQPHPRRS